MAGVSVQGELRAERQRLGLAQTDVARWLGLSRVSVVNFEAGRQDMPISKVVAYADALGMDVRLVPRIPSPSVAPG